MANVLDLDLTGSLPANRITEDIKLSSNNRVFRLPKGSFYAKSLRMVNKATQALLVLGKDYRLGELDIEAVRLTPQHEICKEVVMLTVGISEVSVTYQAIGGFFQFNSVTLAEMLQEYYDSSGALTITNTPDQYAPSDHINHVNDFMKLGGIVTALNRIEGAISAGKSEAMVAAMLAYIEELGKALSDDVKAQANDLLEEVQFLKRRNEYRDGRYYITSRPGNPAAEKGGVWRLDSNVMLYGANNYNDVGQLVDVGEGAGKVAFLKHLWRRSDTGTIVTYGLSSNVTDIDEGQSVTVSLQVRGLAAGTIVPYKITGITADDLTNGGLVGNFILDNNGFATAVIQTVADRKTEGKEVIKLTLTNAPTNYITIGLNDTSLSPVYNVWFSSDAAGNSKVTSINEGADVYIQLGGNDLVEGERLYIVQDGSTTSAADFDIALPAYLDIVGGKASAKFRFKADVTTEGTETLLVSICSTNNISTALVKTTLSVLDTSKAPVYRAKFVGNADGSGATLTQTNEGTVVYLVIDGDNLVNGTVLQMVYGGQVVQDDFVTTLPISATLANGKAILQFSIKNDIRTEGSETFTATVMSGGVNVATASLTIIDTSITMGYDVFFSSTSAGSDRITSVNEGNACYLIINTVGVADNTVLTLNYAGTSVAADFTNTRPTTATVVGNRAIVNFNVAADRTSEGTETLMVVLPNVTGAPSTTINIIDTSVSPTITTKFSSNDRGTDVITSSAEGRSAYLYIQTTNVNNGETLNLTYSGTPAAADFDNTRPTTVTINNNVGVVEYKIKADGLEEGTERLTVTATYPGRSISASSFVDLLDTSRPPKLEITASVAGVAVADLNNLIAYAGQLVELKVTDVNRTLASNAVIYVNVNSSVATSPMTPSLLIPTTIPASVTMTNWVATITFRVDNRVNNADTYTPIAVGLTAAEAATASKTQTNTFKYANVKIQTPRFSDIYFASDAAGANKYTAAIDGTAPLYFIAKATASINAQMYIKGLVGSVTADVASGVMIRDFGPGALFVNGVISTQLQVNPQYFDGVKQLAVYLMGAYPSLPYVELAGTRRSLTIKAPPITDVIITGTAFKTETYNGVTYSLLRELNAWDYFVAKMGRNPRTGESIRYILEAGWSMVPTTTAVASLTFDSRFNGVASKLTIKNAGILLGKGGDGVNVSRGKPGGNAIDNNTTIPLNIENSNVLAGGGGAGNGASGSWNNIPGGGGAPYGFSSGYNPNTASFSVPLSGGIAGGGVWATGGGTWGNAGGTGGGSSNSPSSSTGGDAGRYVKGLVGTITNTGLILGMAP